MASHSAEIAPEQAPGPDPPIVPIVPHVAPSCDACWHVQGPCDDNRPCERCRELGLDCQSEAPTTDAPLLTAIDPLSSHHDTPEQVRELRPAPEAQLATESDAPAPASKHAPSFTLDIQDTATTQELHPAPEIQPITEVGVPFTASPPLPVEHSATLNSNVPETTSTQYSQPAAEAQPLINEDVLFTDAPPITTAHPPSSNLEIPPTTAASVDPLATNVPPFTTEHPSASSVDILDTASTAASSISNPALEVDSGASNYDDASDADSAITDVRGLSSTQSVRSSIYDFVEEHGRTFHRYKEGKYVLPNDAQEQDRLDLQHHLLLILLEGRLQLAPIDKNLQNVLDVGTGTGIWAIEFANRFPSASVIGSDLSPIQPEFVPPNCQFEIDDAEDEWTYSKEFNFIHMRGMMTCFTDPRSVLEKAYNQCAPGGYLEMQDGVFPMHCHDDTLEGTALDTWGKACLEAGAKIGRPWNHAPKYRQWMEDIGFEDVNEKIFEVATSTWPRGRKAKELGMWFQADMMDVLGASKVLLTKVMGWAPETVDMLLVQARNDLKNRSIHAYMPM